MALHHSGAANAMTVQAHMKLQTSEAQDKAWQMLKLMETVSGHRFDYCDYKHVLTTTGLRRQDGRPTLENRAPI